MIAECVDKEAQRAELQRILQSRRFEHSPTLSNLLRYLCEKAFNGESDHIKEYSVALDVFGRKESFDQESSSIVRVEVNRLRKRLAEYYNNEGADHALRITIPVGQYVPAFEPAVAVPPGVPEDETRGKTELPKKYRDWRLWAGISAVVLAIGVVLLVLGPVHRPSAMKPASPATNAARPPSAVAVSEEIRILAGSSRNYVDHSGKIWIPDSFFSGGTPVRNSAQHIWRTQDPAIYRSGRQGDFRYDIPLKPGSYELRLHFAETYYGPEEATGGGEGSRLMTISGNGRVLLADFDVLADSGAGRTADVKVFLGVAPAADGQLHLQFSSSAHGAAMVSGIEIVPGIGNRMKPVRIVARDLPYYSNDSLWWSADVYFKGGQLGGSQEPAANASDPELYETERWGHFSYAIPVAPGRYTVIFHFIEHRLGRQEQLPADQPNAANATETRVFDIFCNGKRVVNALNIYYQVGANRPLVRTITNLEPNAQGKLLLEFIPISHYATVSAVEVLPE
jgi:hypothetical protein